MRSALIRGGDITQMEDTPQMLKAFNSESPYSECMATHFIEVGSRTSDRDLVLEVKQSKRLLELQENWDGEGSAGYAVETLKHAVSFVRNTLTVTRSIRRVPVPEILPADEGSIDVYWKTDTYELLVNIPADVTELATFYGDDFGRLTIEGTFDPTKTNLGIITWLTSNKGV